MNPGTEFSPKQRLALNVLIPLVYFIPLAVAYIAPKNFGFGFPGLTEWGLVVGMLGLFLWITSLINLGGSLAVLPGADRLVTTGLYKYVRHPMYIGITLTLFGLLLACGSTFGMVYLLVVVLPLNGLRIFQEEAALTETFGEAYRAYQKKTFF